MKNYTDWKDKNSGSAILEALNRGNSNAVSSFGSVDQFIHGLLGNNFIKDKAETPKNNQKIEQEIKEEKEKNLKTESFKEEKIKESEKELQEELEESEVLSDDEISSNSLYKIYRDKEENFECNISIQGAKLSNSQVRLIFDHELCNLVFYGKVYKDGKCLVPLKKMSLYPEGSTGRVKLEVIVDDTVFVPWEETFIVEGAKKVTVQIKAQKKVDVRF